LNSSARHVFSVADVIVADVIVADVIVADVIVADENVNRYMRVAIT
jgi:hypothetical protein